MTKQMTDEFGILSACANFVNVFVFIILLVLINSCVSNRYLPQQLEMYQSENSNIETQIEETVKQYQKYETDIFTNVTSDNAITLVSLYPELKADKLVAKQLEIYVLNNKKLKKLN